MSLIDNIIQAVHNFKGYNGNSSLRRKGHSHEYTQEQASEYVKCKLDPIYFINTYGKVISLDKGIVPFTLFDYQVKFIREMHENRRVISMQPRQMGKSQTVAGYILWYVLFNEAKTVAILANKSAAAREILSRLQMMYEALPIWLQQGVVTWNKGSIELENESKVFTAATTSGGIRGKSINFLYVDEVAIIPNNIAEEFFTSVYPTISSGETTKVVLTSTPLGLNHFWKFWQEASTIDEKTGKSINGFIPFRVYYNEHPKRDEKWAAEQKEILGELKYNQEVGCQFLGSSATLISSEILMSLAPNVPIFTSDEGLDILEKPETKAAYVIIADTSKGVGGDFSAFLVIKISEMPYRIVAKYRNNKVSPLLYPNIIYKIAVEYNQAVVLIENNSSEQVPYILYNELEYENVLMSIRDKSNVRISGGFGQNTKLGITTDKKTKRLGCSNLKSLVEERKLLLEDKDVIFEASTFIDNNKGSYEADEGYHDDLMMCLVLFGWLSTDPYFADLTNLDLRKALYEKQIEYLEDNLLPIGVYDDGRDNSILNF